MMAFTHPDPIRAKVRRLAWSAAPGPRAELLRACILGSLGVLGLAALLPGATAGPVALAGAVALAGGGIAAWGLPRDFPHARLGLCNHLTLFRLLLTCALIAPLLAGAPPSWAFFGVAVLALSLDGVDGWIARREGRVSAFGARFDVEVDSLLALILALNAALVTEIGVIAVLLGLPRYAFMLASLGLPWMRRPLPDRFSRKVVCVVQIGALIALQAPILPNMAAALLVPSVAVLLAWSFWTDIRWLRHARR